MFVSKLDCKSFYQCMYWPETTHIVWHVNKEIRCLPSLLGIRLNYFCLVPCVQIWEMSFLIVAKFLNTYNRISIRNDFSPTYVNSNSHQYSFLHADFLWFCSLFRVLNIWPSYAIQQSTPLIYRYVCCLRFWLRS